jgi:LytS/YehU family sensor histidine kinase
MAYYWIEISENNRAYLKYKSDLRDSDHINTLTQKQNLQDMISPHFLFNSLNTLTSIVTESKGMAIRFTSELAYLYDFILKNKGEEMILVDEELNLIQRYVYLLESRYEKALMVDMNIPKAYTNCWIPPLSIQNLIENAVKHNGASKKKPLKIEVFCEDEMIVVRNNIILKKTPPGNSTGIGINYVRTQFRKIAQKEIRIEQNEHNFIVYLPLIYPTDLKVEVK